MSALHLVVFAAAALGPTPSPAAAGRVRVEGRDYVSVPKAVAAGAMRLVVDLRFNAATAEARDGDRVASLNAASASAVTSCFRLASSFSAPSSITR